MPLGKGRGRSGTRLPDCALLKKTATKPSKWFLNNMPAKSLTDRLSFTLLIFIAGKKIWQQLILLDKWRGNPERQQGVLTAAMEVGSRAGIRIQSDLSGTPLEGIASAAGGLHLPLQMWVKPPCGPVKITCFSSSWSTFTTNTDNKYPYHSQKRVIHYIHS